MVSYMNCINVKKIQFKPWYKSDESHMQNTVDHFCEDMEHSVSGHTLIFAVLLCIGLLNK